MVTNMKNWFPAVTVSHVYRQYASADYIMGQIAAVVNGICVEEYGYGECKKERYSCFRSVYDRILGNH